MAAGHDATQLALMEESIVVVDREDRVLRAGSKRECHLNANIDAGLLHRAFSVFLFNSKGQLLLQQRSGAKITFPLYWANTCCSHPLYSAAEMEAHDGAGVKLAAVRKLGHELGIAAEQLPLDAFHYLTRIHYVAKMAGEWGEHEIDWVLVIQRDVELRLEPNEVHQARYFSEEELQAFLDNAEANGELISPWFKHLQERFLRPWWRALREGRITECKDHVTIHRIPPA
jgi:isopentenyl-diphosphate delta-isomerase